MEVKACSFHSSPFTDHVQVTPNDVPALAPILTTPEHESFEKTLSLYAAIQVEGCSAPALSSTKDSPAPGEPQSEPDSGPSTPSRRSSLSSSSSATPLDSAEPLSRRSSQSSSRVAPADAEPINLRAEFRSQRSRRKLGCAGKIVLMMEKSTSRYALQ